MSTETNHTNSNYRKSEKDSGTPGGPPRKPKFGFNLYWVYIIIIFIFIAIHIFTSYSKTVNNISWQQFNKEMLQQHDVDKIVVVNGEVAEVYIKKDSLKKATYDDVRQRTLGSFENAGPHYEINIGKEEIFREDLRDAEKEFSPEDKVNVFYETRRDVLGGMLTWILPLGLFVAIWVFLMRRMSGGSMGGSQIFNIGKSRATLFDRNTQVSVTFDDVAGLEGAKVEIKEIVDFLKNPSKYTDLGGKIPKGALLVGPPGTGKTLIAKAVAGEAKVPFFSLSGSDFVEMFVGVGASRVRDLFKQAKEKAPCIVFIDEIDAIGRSRGKSLTQGANDERENTLNQLLTEMDGFGTNSGVIILAATNRADVLDRALLRPGRFDRLIYVELPDLHEREAIFKVHLKNLKKLDSTVDISFLARQTPGFSGADIANICNEAALIAARKDKAFVSKQEFLDAVDRIIGGMEKKNKVITMDEKKVIAYHESGHATVSWLVEHASPLVKVTIVPRGKSLGAAWYLPEERQITTTEQMLDEICATLGGRAAEEVIFGKISTGALNDLEKVTKQAQAMVMIYGLNSRIGNLSYYDSTGQSEYSLTKPYSEQTAQIIDEEVSKIVEAQYQRAKDILLKNKDKLVLLAEKLLKEEVIFKEDLEVIFGQRPFVKNGQEVNAPSQAPAEPIQPSGHHTPGAGPSSSTETSGPDDEKSSDQQQFELNL
ncbi:MAG: ATP-dependent zinc metalloprotease FtsH [Flavobacteriales bacterium]|nr:ATP-dependent zinc metalloprotease FtsH [Flavobacteriales bacterium]MCB9448828.1 ATP-dependent zinc metalloprotease FtsH [Flavobacteriales bacterium]